MTLIAIFIDKKAGEVRALADTRVTDTYGLTLTDYSPKLFALPIRETVGNPKFGKILRWECGFAFAGYVMGATFVFSTASAILSNIYRNDGVDRLSLSEVAEIVRRVYEDIFYDICFRKVNLRDFILNSAVSIFGFCPVEKNFKCFVIRSGYVVGHPIVTLGETPFNPVGALLGAGKQIFEKQMNASLKKNGKANIMSIFRDVVYDPAVTDVGGDIQVLTATSNGVFIPPVLNRTYDPDAPDFKIYGILTDHLAPKERFTVGYQEPGAVFFGFGLEDSVNRTFLRRLGIDPDSMSITRREKNTAGIFGAVSSCWMGKDEKVKLDRNTYSVASLRPFVGQCYFGCYCPRCSTFCALIPDTDGKSLDNIWEGDGLLNVMCRSCAKAFIFPPWLLTTARWNATLEKKYPLKTTTFLS